MRTGTHRRGKDEAAVGRWGTHTAGWGRDGNARVAGQGGEAARVAE